MDCGTTNLVTMIETLACERIICTSKLRGKLNRRISIGETQKWQVKSVIPRRRRIIIIKVIKSWSAPILAICNKAAKKTSYFTI